MSTRNRLVLFVLPAYDEAACIEELLEAIERVMSGIRADWRAIVADDGSSDGTPDIASAVSERLPVKVLRGEVNRGLGHTLRRGLTDAVRSAADGDVVVTMDCDLTHDPSHVPAMLQRLDEGADVVIASRYRRGSAVTGLGALRRLLSVGASAFAGLAAPVPGVRDYSCGLRAYRVEALRWGFDTYGDGFVTEEGFGSTLEILLRLRRRAVFAEVPFVLRYDRKRKPSAMRVLPTIGAYLRVARAARRHDEAHTLRYPEDLSRPPDMEDG